LHDLEGRDVDLVAVADADLVIAPFPTDEVLADPPVDEVASSGPSPGV
jgi:hypothetical protein